jgi:cytochrome oxidase Cu insertion factor (SCO1/SenC/PrrC family)
MSAEVLPDRGSAAAPARAPGRFERLGVPLVFAAVFVLVPVALFVARHRTAPPPEAALPDYGAVPSFSLTERSERRITLDDLRGYVWIADFIFTNCAGPCPLMTQRMAALQEELPLKKGLRLVSISVDPERDTPEVLRSYAEAAGARKDLWLFLTGERAAIFKLAVEGFHMGSTSDPLLHSTRFALVDRQGRIRGYYDYADEGMMTRLRADVTRLIRENAS